MASEGTISSTVTDSTAPLDEATVVHSSVSSRILTPSTSNFAVPPILQTTTVPRTGSTGETRSNEGRAKLSGAVGASAHAATSITMRPAADQRMGFEQLVRELS